MLSPGHSRGVLGWQSESGAGPARPQLQTTHRCALLSPGLRQCHIILRSPHSWPPPLQVKRVTLVVPLVNMVQYTTGNNRDVVFIAGAAAVAFAYYLRSRCSSEPDRTFKENEKLLVLCRGEVVDAIFRGGHAKTERNGRFRLKEQPYCKADKLTAASSFYEVRQKYCATLAEKVSTVEDSITGKTVHQDSLIYIGLEQDGSTDLANVKSLSQNLFNLKPEASSFLLIATAGKGKTWCARQLTYLLSERALKQEGLKPPLVPMLLTVQDLASALRKGEDNKSLETLCQIEQREECNVLLMHIEQNFQGQEQLLLRVAFDLRLLCVQIDGIDEVPVMHTMVRSLLLLLSRLGIRAIATCVLPRRETVTYGNGRGPRNHAWFCAASLTRVSCSLATQVPTGGDKGLGNP